MKRIVLLSIIICYNLAVFSQATDLVVDCQTPGWLSSKINYGDQLTVKNLKVTGYINSDDLHFIGELMDNYQLHGRIDLSDVGVVGNKMDPYTNFGITNNEYTIQYLALPKSLTEVSEVMRSYKGNLSSYLKVDTLEFSPNNIKYVKASFFDNRQFESSIKHLILGEKIDSIPDDAFFDKGGVSSLKLPVGMKYIGKRAFMENYQSINDVNFNELSNLKYIGPGAFCGGYMSTTELYQPDTLIIPKSLDIRFVLFAFTYRDGQHIFMDNNIKEISGIGIGSGGKEVSGNTTAALKIHINNETPPTLISYKGLNNETKFGNSTIYVPKGAKQAYLDSDWSNATIIEVDPQTTLNISAYGNGSVLYDNSIIKNQTKTFSIEEGSSAIITFSPDNGYRIASVKLNGADVTSSITNNQYIINNISCDNTLEVEFEAIPTYSLNITASSNGTATYNGTAVKGKSQVFPVNEGTSATIMFTPDAGYKIKSVKLNSTDVTSSIVNNQYTISNIKSDNTLEVEFEAITHTLTIKASGNGSATFNSTAVKGKSQTFTVNEGISATVTFTPDAGYKIKSVKLNAKDVTANVVSNQYTISDITSDNTLEVDFEAITHTLTIKVTGNGSATFNSTAVKGKSQTFTVNEGASATVTFIPDANYKIKSIKLNTTDITSSVKDNQYTISNINSDNTLEVEFEAIIHTLNIVAIGNGNVDYNGVVIRNQSQSYSVQEGSSVVLSFTPDAGYRVGNVKVNNTDVTANVTNNSYTISNITANTTLSVSFEAVPPTTYAFTISAVGNGTVTYDENTVRGKTSSFTVFEGTNVKVTFSADEGYRLKSVKLNTTDVTSSVVNNQYTITNIKANTSLEVTFEAIPTYALNITSSGNGSATFNGTTVKGKTQTFTVIEGTSAIVTFAPDAGYRIASVKLNNTDVTASVANNSYTISNITSNTTLSVTFEAIPPTTYALTISAEGNGYVAFDGNTIRSKTSSFDVIEGTNAALTFSADEGNRLKSVKLNGQDVTSSIVGNQYTITNITANTTIEVVFETIPTYALNIVATGNGSASYDGVIIRNQSQNFTLREGASAVVSFSADNGYRIASVKVNNADVTSQIVDGKITINNITQNTNVEVVFEEIPPIVYALSITATGNGSVTYDGNTVKGKTSTFTIIEGSYITVQMSADDGYRLKSITLNGQDVTADVANNQYTTPKMMADAALVVVFEAIPTFALTIKSSAFGSVKFGDAIIANRTETFSVREGTSATMTFTPDDNGRLHSITLNGTDITKELVNGQYTISNIRSDQSVEAEFVEDITKVTDAGIAYTVTSYDEQTVVVAAGNYGKVLTVPASFTAKEKTWTVVGIDEDALKDNTALAAIFWNPEVAFTAKVSNPNLLLYVKDAQYAPATIQNVVVNNQAENIVLVEAASGNDFYCPQAFTAKRISYEHNYSMISGYKTCQGWETLVLPFDVTMMINAKGQELTPYINWQYGNSLRPFWLYEMTTQGWKAGSAIKANTPYIISMPNNEMYDVSFNQTGNIQFIGTNVEVKASTEMKTGQHGNKRLVANYQTQEPNADIYALNVSNEWSQNTAMEVEGSTFIRSLRSVHPFEAYLTVEGSNAPLAIPLFENMPTGINEKLIMNGEKFATATDWYTIDGRKLQGEPKQNGIYIIKGKKVRK